MKDKRTILGLAAHPDDIEFSCGGTVKKFIERGCTFWYVVLSPCNKSLPEGCRENQLYEEVDRAVAHLGISNQNILKYNYPVRDFPAHRQAILEDFVQLKKDIQPDLILLPNSFDVHQDHHVVHEEGVRAFKNSSILGYELPWNNFQMHLNYFVTLEEKHIKAKLKAIEEYKTQKERYYNSGQFFLNLAKVRGVKVNATYAETFQILRLID